MKNFTLYFVLAVFCLMGMSGCGPQYSSKQSEVISQGTYAVGDALEAGRYDLAKPYNDEVKKVVVPPKKKIAIAPLYNKTSNERYVVVPENIKGKVVAVGSAEYQELLKNKETLKQVEGEKAFVAAYSNRVVAELQKEQIIKETAMARVNKLEKELAEGAKYKYICFVLAAIFVFWIVNKFTRWVPFL